MRTFYCLRYKQSGQAIIFGLLFMAVAVMTLLILYNQGQLVHSRVQIENAADAAVYSQAKLAARNQNFIAYTNRAMVANEVSIGQMVALLSWAKHYKQVPAFTSFPLYNVPIAPPSPVTMGQILNVVTTPWVLMGTAVEAPTNIMVNKWPMVISYFNGALGLFQKVFALSTMAAQIEINLNVVEDHEFDPDNPEMYTPVVGWYFFTQNILLTYFGENFSPDNVHNALVPADTDGADEHELVAAFLGGQVGTLDTMINDNTPGIGSRAATNVGGGVNANLNASEEGDSAVEAYQRYAAIVNRNRESFTQDRHWDFGINEGVGFDLEIPLGIVTLRIELDVEFFAGIKKDGGTAYLANNDLANNEDLSGLGWASIDVASFGIEVDISLFVNVEICFIECTNFDLIDVDFSIPMGLPLAGATHQVVSDVVDSKKQLADWGFPGMSDPGMYGGDPDDFVNNGSFDLFHAAALGWGQASPSLLPGMYGIRPIDVTDSYGAPPAFYSLGGVFQESGVSYEFTIALAKSLDDIATSDSAAIDINTGDDADWDDGNIAYTRFDIDTRSRAEGTDFSAAYQREAWMDERPMMTVSSAETYFSNPMQQNNDGSAEPASLFSPFWDARLREPSAVAILIATGEVDWEDMIDGLSGSAVDIVEWMLNAVGDRVIDSSVDYLVAQVDAPFDSVIEPPLHDAATQVKDVAIGAAIDQLEDFLP
ncbi:MAG: hypothetical protein COA83_05665 [Methylophaga sp.]|nr:MAG: hypothetical protein COA83_05665 [Methylophaga sp.]